MSRKIFLLVPALALFAAGCSLNADESHPVVQPPAPPVPVPVVAPAPTITPTTTTLPSVQQPATTSTETAPTASSTSAISPGVYVFADKTIKEDGKEVSFDITYPQMTAGADATVQKAFNQIVFEKNIRDQVAQMRTDVANAVKEGMMTSGGWFLDLSGGVGYQSPRLVSVFLSGSQDTGGAHPNAFYENVLFDPSLKKEISVSQLFENASSSLQQVATWTRADLKKNADMLDYTDPDWMAGGTDPTESNYQFSHFTTDGFVVTIPPYQVAAYVAGPQEVTIPWEKINPLLKTEYQKK
jgi:hypothetical protein